ncbi:MAG: hypothetical protein B7Y25_07095, partial [Alphaproteobacteria bacterium 16-39-46]
MVPFTKEFLKLENEYKLSQNFCNISWEKYLTIEKKVSSRYRRVNEILGITRCWVEGLIVRRLNGQGKA